MFWWEMEEEDGGEDGVVVVVVVGMEEEMEEKEVVVLVVEMEVEKVEMGRPRQAHGCHFRGLQACWKWRRKEM